MSACTATSFSSVYRVSKATSDFPANAEELKVKVMSMLPSSVSAIKVSHAIISLPSASVITSPLTLSTSFPVITYSRPTSKPLYSTVSTITASSFAFSMWSSVSSPIAVVLIFGT